MGLFLISVLATSLSVNAYASTGGKSPFEDKLPKQAVNKSITGKNALWLKHTGSANSPVCGVELCKAPRISAQLPDGSYPLKAHIKP